MGLRAVTWAAVASFTALVAGCGGTDAAEDRSRPSQVSAQKLLRGEPYMGVACPATNAHACDRIGLSIVLSEPAATVSAEIEGRRFALADPEWSGTLRNWERTRFAGFLQPAGLREAGPHRAVRGYGADAEWIAKDLPPYSVTIHAERKDGSREVATVMIGLAPGWG